MREIVFRGRRMDNSEWVEGYLLETIHPAHKVFIVNPETVGRYTGLCDTNGKRIFEGDIIKTKEYGKNCEDKYFSGYDICEVVFVDGSFMIRNNDRVFYLLKRADKEIIGNIYDNPELLEGKHD